MKRHTSPYVRKPWDDIWPAVSTTRLQFSLKQLDVLRPRHLVLCTSSIRKSRFDMCDSRCRRFRCMLSICHVQPLHAIAMTATNPLGIYSRCRRLRCLFPICYVYTASPTSSQLLFQSATPPTCHKHISAHPHAKSKLSHSTTNIYTSLRQCPVSFHIVRRNVVFHNKQTQLSTTLLTT